MVQIIPLPELKPHSRKHRKQNPQWKMGRKQEVFSDSTSFLVLLYIPELIQQHNNLLHISGVLHESPKQRQRAGCPSQETCQREVNLLTCWHLLSSSTQEMSQQITLLWLLLKCTGSSLPLHIVQKKLRSTNFFKNVFSLWVNFNFWFFENRNSVLI